MFEVLRYILTQNKPLDVPGYLLRGIVFQLFKRLIGSVVSKQIFNGKSIFLYPHCTISSMFAYTAIPDREEINVLRNILLEREQQSVFLDIGANIGSYSVCLMDLCDEILAFEPHPYTLGRCKMNFLLNGFDETCVHPIALSNHCGSTRFSDFGSSSTVNRIIDEKEGIEVAVSTLDAFARTHRFSHDKTYLLKVDVEGHEYSLFQGAEMFLTQYKISGILFECFEREPVFSLLRGYGYTDIVHISGSNYLAQKR